MLVLFQIHAMTVTPLDSIRFSYSFSVTLFSSRLSSIGYEHLMIFSVFYTRLRVRRVILLRLFTFLFLCIMPVVTRSQALIHQEACVLSSNPSNQSMSPVIESSIGDSSSSHPTSPSLESLDDSLCTVASTSLIIWHSDHTVPTSSLELIASTSLIDEHLNHINIPSLYHDHCIQSYPSSSLVSPISNSKFQNSSANIEFQISQCSALDASPVYQSQVLNAHNLEFPKSFTMNDDDVDAPFDAGAKARAVATQAIVDMDTLFMAIKSHLADTTQQLSGDFKKVIDDNAKFKQEMRGELDEMRQFLMDQKRLLDIQSSSSSSSSSSTAPHITPSVSASSPPQVMLNSSVSGISG